MQEAGYDGNPAKLRDKIAKSVRRYAKVLVESGPKNYKGEAPASGPGQRTPPFATPPSTDPFNPVTPPNYQPGPYQPGPYQPAPSFPPPEPPPAAPTPPPTPPAPVPDSKPVPVPVDITGNWGALPVALYTGALSVFLLFGLQAWKMYRDVRTAAGKPLVLTDAQAAQIAALLTAVAGGGVSFPSGPGPGPK